MTYSLIISISMFISIQMIASCQFFMSNVVLGNITMLFHCSDRPRFHAAEKISPVSPNFYANLFQKLIAPRSTDVLKKIVQCIASINSIAAIGIYFSRDLPHPKGKYILCVVVEFDIVIQCI